MEGHNRTFVELKQVKVKAYVSEIGGHNRTFVELKPNKRTERRSTSKS